MLRASLIAAVAAGLAATPSFADEATTAGAASVQAFTNQLTWLANQKQMRKMLSHQGYIVTSDLNRADTGYLVGSALKDGKQVIVGVKMPPRQKAEPLVN
jgi:hypothetical protein